MNCRDFLIINSELVFLGIQNDVGDDTEDKSAGDGGDGYLAESYAKTADAGDKYGSNYEEVSVFAKIDLLNHLETGNCDETVKRYANTAHYTRGDGVYECNKGREEGDENCHDSGGDDGCNGSITGDSNAANGFTVSGVGAATEECTDHGANTITEEGAVQAGILQKILADNRGKVLVVSDMLSKYDECNGNIGNCDCTNLCAGNFFETGNGLDEGKCGEREKALEGEGREGVYKSGVVDDFESIVAGYASDTIENTGCNVTSKNTEDEGNKLAHALAVNGAAHSYEQSDEADNKSDVNAAAVEIALLKVVYCIDCKAETYKSNSGTDYNGRHELVDPLDANALNDNSKNNIYKACKDGAEDKAEVAYCNGTCESCSHGAKESKGRTEEYGAVCLSEKYVNKSTYTRT